ncbi:aldolase/citrate lyase family protein [Sphingobium xenophagum]
MSNNPFKNSLFESRPQIGLWLALADPYAAELCAASGFDWLLIDAEHAPNDLRSILSQLRAAATYGAQAMVRAPSDDRTYIKQLLDIGVTNLMVPMISTAQQAEQLVQSVRYPPKGKRGIGHAIGRASKWNRNPNYWADWEDDCCLIAQIESREALDNIEAIVAVDGIDGVFVGPADLAASLGYPGDMGNPAVQNEIDNAIARILAAGGVAGVLCAGVNPAARYFENGCNFVAAGVDVLLLADAVDTLLSRVRDRFPRP